MNIKLHHVNISSRHVAEMDTFYRDVIGLKPEPGLNETRVKTQGYPGEVAFLSDGAIQMHLAEKDMEIGFRTGQVVNPLLQGHIAFRTDDIATFKKHLDAKGIKYSDFGAWAMRGWEQIFFHDPDGNVVEVHQVHED